MPFKPALALALSASLLVTACAKGGPDGRRGPPPGAAGMAEHGPMDPERMKSLVTRYTERWDANNDGAATCDDINLTRSRLFRVLDEDKDGFLNSGEYRHAKFEDKSFLFFDFMAVDKDHDGSVSVEELVAVPNSQFLAADNDHDCRISADEAMMALEEMQRGFGRPESGRGGKRGRGGPGGQPPQVSE
ncbi:hypothetical protein [Kordiimonas gwangyangensis]|uniref:hypothetical protein n=2 Tax=Kordiimonas gwangyangensis TaxID=288022 RepID=UPI0009DB464C|nr:hypothetical protein [Kordiimonas gwangyangensis]